MPYTKTTWQDGDIITTEKLNKIENGIEQASSGSGGGRIIDFTKLEHREEVDPESDDEDIINYFSGYEAGLSEEDFINSWLTGIGRRGELVPIAPIRIDDGFVILYAGDKPYGYNPETGEFSYVIAGGNPK